MAVTSFTPARAPHAFRRARLVAQLDPIRGHAVTLICAPPGTGKSTLVADWIATRPDLYVHWVNTDDRANRQGALATYLAHELLPASDDRPVPSAATALQLGDHLALMRPPEHDVVVVLDDAQEITDRAVWEELAVLATRSPLWLHWVIISRVDPPLRSQRLALEGRLIQLRVADLAFDAEEANELVRWFGLSLPPDVVRRLVSWSEGWAAALCLAARTIQMAGDEPRPWERLDTSEAMVVDYLVEEILDRLGPSDRRFLLRVSAADLITPELATVLTGNDRAAERLKRLERSGTFLLEVDHSGTRYRFHALMAALLRARLHDQLPAEATELVASAARWYAEHGYPEQAERHAVRAGDWTLVAQLSAARCASQLLHTGRVTRANLPMPTANEPTLELIAAFGAGRRDERRGAHRSLADAAALIEEPRAPATRLLRELALVEHAWRSAPSPVRLDATAMWSHSELADADALRSYIDLRESELSLASGGASVATGRLADLVLTPDAEPWVRHEAEAVLALAEAASADPSRATTLARTATTPSKDAASWLAMAGAVIHGLRGETVGLRSQAEALGRDSDAPTSWLYDQCLRVLLAAARWQPPAIAPAMERPAAGLPTEVALALGVVEVIDHNGRVQALGTPLEATIAVARRALADGSSRRLELCLRPWADGVPDDAHLRTVVELHVLQAVAALRQQREDDALERVEAAFAMAATSGLWGPIVARQQELGSLLERHSWQLGASSAAAVLALDHLQPEDVLPLETLTDRERAVLHYLPTLMSNAEIAEAMLVSVNTVKSHLKAIYRKLGVTRRRDALLRARQIELV